MFRKTALALATVAALATTVVAPTTASAGWRHHHHSHGHHFHRGGGRWIGPALLGAAILGTTLAASCYRNQWVETPRGPRLVRVYVC